MSTNGAGEFDAGHYSDSDTNSTIPKSDSMLTVSESSNTATDQGKDNTNQQKSTEYVPPNLKATDIPPNLSSQDLGKIDFCRLLNLPENASDDQMRSAVRTILWKYAPEIDPATGQINTESLSDDQKEISRRINRIGIEIRDRIRSGWVSSKEDVQTSTIESETITSNNLINKEGALLLDNPIVKSIKEKHDTGQIGTIPKEKIDEEMDKGGFTLRTITSVVAFLALDLTINQGRGLSSFLENVIQDEANFRFIIPTLKSLGVSLSTIEELFFNEKNAARSLFQLQPEAISEVVHGMTLLQRQDLVSSLSPEEQVELLFVEKNSRRVPFDRLNPTQIDDLFNSDTLTESFINEIRSTLLNTGKIKPDASFKNL